MSKEVSKIFVDSFLKLGTQFFFKNLEWAWKAVFQIKLRTNNNF